jgi:hypothetical protein
LSWTIPFDNYTDIQAYQIQVHQAGTLGYSIVVPNTQSVLPEYTVPGLDPSSRFVFTVGAINAHGVASMSPASDVAKTRGPCTPYASLSLNFGPPQRTAIYANFESAGVSDQLPTTVFDRPFASVSLTGYDRVIRGPDISSGVPAVAALSNMISSCVLATPGSDVTLNFERLEAVEEYELEVWMHNCRPSNAIPNKQSFLITDRDNTEQQADIDGSMYVMSSSGSAPPEVSTAVMKFIADTEGEAVITIQGSTPGADITLSGIVLRKSCSEAARLVPNPPMNPQAVSVDFARMNITWSKPPWAPGPEITSYSIVAGSPPVVKVDNINPTAMWAEVTSLDIATEYELRVVAINPEGPSTPSKALVVKTACYTQRKFDATFYRDRYADVALRFTGDKILEIADHWRLTGIPEKRIGCAGCCPGHGSGCFSNGIFDPVYYAAEYRDVFDAFADDAAQLVNHWRDFGIQQLRTGCSGCCRGQAAMLPQLQLAFTDPVSIGLDSSEYLAKTETFAVEQVRDGDTLSGSFKYRNSAVTAVDAIVNDPENAQYTVAFWTQLPLPPTFTRMRAAAGGNQGGIFAGVYEKGGKQLFGMIETGAAATCRSCNMGK